MTEIDFILRLLPTAPTLAIFLFLWYSGTIKFRTHNGEDKPKWADDLIESVNHTQTDILQEIRDDQRDHIKKIEEMRDCVKRANNKLDILYEFGTKIRKE